MFLCKIQFLSVLALVHFLGGIIGTAQAEDWEGTIRSFEEKDSKLKPAEGGTVFIGSSNFSHWAQLEDDFKEFQAINRSFGGSWLTDQIRYVDRIVLPYKPSRIVLWGGPNELGKGKSVSATFDSLNELIAKIRKHLPDVTIYIVSLKPNLRADKPSESALEFNRLNRELSGKESKIHYIDVTPAFYDKDGTLKADLYVKDKLHMNRKGQEAIIPIIKSALSTADNSKK